MINRTEQIANLIKAHGELQERLTAAEKERDRYRNALKCYANPDAWTSDRWLYGDGTATARKALEGE